MIKNNAMTEGMVKSWKDWNITARLAILFPDTTLHSLTGILLQSQAAESNAPAGKKKRRIGVQCGVQQPAIAMHHSKSEIAEEYSY